MSIELQMIEIALKPHYCKTDVSGSPYTSDVYLMDCMELMAKYPDNYFDLAVVDPPYGLNIINSGSRFKQYSKKNWDNEIPKDEYFTELFRVSKNQIIWGGNYFNLPGNKCFLIWDKIQPEGVSFAMAEYAWTSLNTVAKIHRQRVQGQEQRFHPTQKPVKLYDWIFKNYATEGMKILDTHLGSGSSRISANKANLNFVGCEIDKEYFDKSQKRYDDFVSQVRLW